MAKYGARIGAALSCALMLAGCGSSGDASDNASGNASGGGETPAAGGGMPANWKATDACSILDKSAVAETLKQDVSEALVSLVTEPGTATAAMSECTYSGAEGIVGSLMTRWSPINDQTPETIAAAQSTAAAAMKAFGKVPEEVPGMGKGAFFAPGINQLTVFLDDARMLVVTARKLPDGLSGKDAAIALAKKAGA